MRCYRWNGNNVVFTVSSVEKMRTHLICSHRQKDDNLYSKLSSALKITTCIMRCHRPQKDHTPEYTLSSLTDHNVSITYASDVDTCRYNVVFSQTHICIFYDIDPFEASYNQHTYQTLHMDAFDCTQPVLSSIVIIKWGCKRLFNCKY